MRVFDTIPFYNEMDILELRLHTLDAVVDHFVIAEMTRTHAGRHKPLYFAAAKDRFYRFARRLIHVVVDDAPGGPDPWARDFHLRDAVARGLTACQPEDIILISSTDEIPRPEKVLEYKATDGVKGFMQRLYYYYMNCQCLDPWLGTRMLSYDTLVKRGGRAGDIQLRQAPDVLIPDGGWHFSYMGGVRAIQDKLETYAHQEYNTEKYKDASRIAEYMDAGRDLFDRDVKYAFVPIDDSYPPYVLDHPRRFSRYMGPAEVTGA